MIDGVCLRRRFVKRRKIRLQLDAQGTAWIEIGGMSYPVMPEIIVNQSLAPFPRSVTVGEPPGISDDFKRTFMRWMEAMEKERRHG